MNHVADVQLMSERSWTEAEIRAIGVIHWPLAVGDEDEGYSVVCGGCDDWTTFDSEHVIDVLKASRTGG